MKSNNGQFHICVDCRKILCRCKWHFGKEMIEGMVYDDSQGFKITYCPEFEDSTDCYRCPYDCGGKDKHKEYYGGSNQRCQWVCDTHKFKEVHR